MLEYLALLIELLKLRDRMIAECDEEVSLLDRMEEAWGSCDEDERKLLTQISQEFTANKMEVKKLEQVRKALEKNLREH